MPNPRSFRVALNRMLALLVSGLAACSVTPPPPPAHSVVKSGGAVTQPPPPPPPRDEAHASFWQRFDNIGPTPLNPPLTWYQPIGTLAGRPGAFLPVDTARHGAFPDVTVHEAESFADGSGGDALLVAHKGTLELEHYAPDFKAAPDHVFSAHSMSRGLGAIAIGILIDQGRIKSVDEPAADFIPAWRNDPRRAITIRQLLTMSSGLRSSLSLAPGSEYIQSYYGADVAQIVANAPLAGEPGKTFFYDTHNNHALGLIIERASGLPYLAFVSQSIWQKLGAGDAKMMLDHPSGRVMAYCCMLTTPRDWLRVGELLRNGGVWGGQRIVSESWVKQMRTPSAANPNFGFQLFLGSAYMNPDINRQAPKQRPTLEPLHAADAYYLAGAGDINLMVIPSQGLTILRTGLGSPLYRFHVVPNLLTDALTGQTPPGAWESLLSYRATLPKFGANPTLTNTGLFYWPTVRIAGVAHPAPLPRKTLMCGKEDPFRAIDARLAQKPDYAFLVLQKNALVHSSYGGAMDAATRGESASMHKSVLALVVGALVSDGKIKSVEQPISTWLPEWAHDPRGQIKLRDLLQMASGLKPVRFDMSPTGLTQTYLRTSDIEHLVLTLSYQEAPGKSFEYFSQISSLIAVIAERAAGRAYPDLLATELWQKIGASDAYVTLDRPGGLARTAASLLATAEDWVRVGELIRDNGIIAGHRVLPAAWIAAMTSASPANPHYGYQIWRASPYLPERFYSSSDRKFTVKAEAPFLAADTVYFDGAVGRRVYISKSSKTVIVRLGDTDMGWEDSWLPNEVYRALEACEAGARSQRGHS